LGTRSFNLRLPDQIRSFQIESGTEQWVELCLDRRNEFSYPKKNKGALVLEVVVPGNGKEGEVAV
jgi:hypothetical protein